MLHPRNIGRRVTAFSIVSGTVGLAYVALIPPNLDAPSAKAEVAAISMRSMAPVFDVSPLPDNQYNAAANTCSTQNWPFYSNDCLRGDDVAKPLRQVHLEPVSATLFAAPDVVRESDMIKTKSLEPRQFSGKPQRRKVREATYQARHKTRPAQSQVAESREPVQALAFSW